MRGNGNHWKGVAHCYNTTRPFYLLSKNELAKVGWKITNEKNARTAWTYSTWMYSGVRHLLYHIGYTSPINGEKARLRRLESGFSKERVRQIQKNYPRQTSFFRVSFLVPKIEGNDIDPFDIEIEVETLERPTNPRIRLRIGGQSSFFHKEDYLAIREKPDEIEIGPYDIQIEVLPLN